LPSPNTLFSHLYVESDLLDHRIVREVQARLPNAVTIPVPHYKAVFNRAGQDARLQRKGQKLILARKRPPFIHKGASIIQDFGNHHLYYTPQLFNCIYDCSYCYLQGIYPSANLVVFVNTDDYFRHLDTLLPDFTPNAPLYLCISYDTDLLALEGTLGMVEKWITYARTQPHLLIENRTKSANFSAIAHLTPAKNVILAWSLLPDSIAREMDRKAPPLAKRLEAVRQATEAGWQVRLAFEPIVWQHAYATCYPAFIHEVFSVVDPAKIREVNVDLFRINRDFLERMKRNRPEPVLYYPYQIKEGLATYDDATAQALKRVLKEALSHYLPPEKCFFQTY